jgi:hypothetical protein
MDTEFARALAEWREFFSAVASISGTLVGLLFVALGLNPTIMADSGPAGLRVWARQTFHTFLVLMLLGLIGLVPADNGTSFAITLSILGIQGIGRVALDVRRVRRDPDPNWGGRQALTRFISPTLAYLFCLWLAWRCWENDADDLGWLIAIVFLLTINAAATSWDLLKAIGDANRGDEPASPSSA